MAIIKPDKIKYEEENAELEKKQREDNDRADYLERLKNSRKFQKYVIKEIFEKQINETFSLDRIPLTDEMDKLGTVTLQYILARKAVEKMLDKLK
jgi:hypothetical protein